MKLLNMSINEVNDRMASILNCYVITVQWDRDHPCDHSINCALTMNLHW